MHLEYISEQRIKSDPLSTAVLSPRAGELNLVALNLRNQGDPQAFNIAMGEYMKAMIDSSIDAINRRYPDRRLDSFERKELLNLGIPLSLEHLFANSCSDPPQSKEEELWRGVSRGDLAVVERLSNDLSVDVNAEFKDYYGQYSPLNLAAKRGHRGIVECLLRNPRIDVNFKGDRHHPSPFYSALKAKNVEVAHMLLDDPRTVVTSAETDCGGSDVTLWDVSHEIFLRIMKNPGYKFESVEPVKFILDKGIEDESLATVLSHPHFDVNEYAYFLRVCTEKRPDWMIELFLAHPQLDVNQGNPLGEACSSGDFRIIDYLLADQRTDVSFKDEYHDPFYFHVDVVKRLLFSGIELDFAGESGERLETVLNSPSENMKLYRSYKSDPIGTRVKIRLEFVSKLFAMVVLLSDGYLELGQSAVAGRGMQPKKIGKREKSRERFFRIAQKLPMELQMMICHRAYGSLDDSVSSFDFESAFKALEI